MAEEAAKKGWAERLGSLAKDRVAATWGWSGLAPHPAHARADVDARTLACFSRRGAGRYGRPTRALKQSEQLLGNEARPGRLHMPVALRALTMREEPLRHHKMEIVLCARHGDVEQAAFLLELGGSSGA